MLRSGVLQQQGEGLIANIRQEIWSPFPTLLQNSPGDWRSIGIILSFRADFLNPTWPTGNPTPLHKSGQGWPKKLTGMLKSLPQAAENHCKFMLFPVLGTRVLPRIPAVFPTLLQNSPGDWRSMGNQMEKARGGEHTAPKRHKNGKTSWEATAGKPHLGKPSWGAKLPVGDQIYHQIPRYSQEFHGFSRNPPHALHAVVVGMLLASEPDFLNPTWPTGNPTP